MPGWLWPAVDVLSRDPFDDLEDFHDDQGPHRKLKVTSCQHYKVTIIRVTLYRDVSRRESFVSRRSMIGGWYDVFVRG